MGWGLSTVAVTDRASTLDAPTGPHLLDGSSRAIFEQQMKGNSLMYIEHKPGNACSGLMQRLVVLEAKGPSGETPASQLDKAALTRFRQALEVQGVNVSKWGANGNKSLEQLFWEAYEQRCCVMTGLHTLGRLKRVTRLVKIHLKAPIFGVEHTLVSRIQFLHDGQSVERRQVPVRKLAWLPSACGGGAPEAVQDEPALLAEDCPHTEPWPMACRRTLEERFGLSDAWQDRHLEEDVHAYSYHTEDGVESLGYPGLTTLYCIHEVTLRVVDPDHPEVSCLGLPQGRDFATKEGQFSFGSLLDKHGSLPIGSQLNIWTWVRVEVPGRKSICKVHAGPAVVNENSEAEQRTLKRVPLPEMSPAMLEACAAFQRAVSGADDPEQPNCALARAVNGQTTDWVKARDIARRISDASYTLREFTADLDAFPELRLYLMESNAGARGHLSSGRTVGDEYQRTIGAFFAIYWLLRLHCDGREGFSFGVDDEWRPFQASRVTDNHRFPADKRIAFYRDSSWDYFRRLLVAAGLLEAQDGRLEVNEKRVTALLALTAIHDLMKIEAILPKVAPEHAPYHGYNAGDVVGDHDHALSYLMDYYPELLPSFLGLDPEERRSVQFTQCQLCFNHGWFVQAEAPPGAIFTKFKEVLRLPESGAGGEDEGGQRGMETAAVQARQARDIALYFVHWLTDLAGAEPTPLGGCEKFVVKFPLPVLNSFLSSFEFVEKIAELTETEVMEQYLKARWQESSACLGPVPSGDTAIVQMRLLCMAQMNAQRVLQDLHRLPDEALEVISVEMARTGCAGQSFSLELAPPQARSCEGPAFLVYYGPAFLQNLGGDLPVKRLGVLAEVYRCARELWPASADLAALTVTVRIDAIKALGNATLVEALQHGDLWVLVKKNQAEAFIELMSQKQVNDAIRRQGAIQVLDLAFLTL